MAFDPERRDWSLLTISNKGTVSLLRNLTLAQVKEVYMRLDPFRDAYAVVDEKGSGPIYGVNNTIKQREVFGPQGWDDSEVRDWRKPTKRIGPLKDEQL